MHSTECSDQAACIGYLTNMLLKRKMPSEECQQQDPMTLNRRTVNANWTGKNAPGWRDIHAIHGSFFLARQPSHHHHVVRLPIGSRSWQCRSRMECTAASAMSVYACNINARRPIGAHTPAPSTHCHLSRAKIVKILCFAPKWECSSPPLHVTKSEHVEITTNDRSVRAKCDKLIC